MLNAINSEIALRNLKILKPFKDLNKVYLYPNQYKANCKQYLASSLNIV